MKLKASSLFLLIPIISPIEETIIQNQIPNLVSFLLAPTMSSFILYLILLALSWPLRCHSHVGGSPGILAFDIHHRFSDNVRRWADSIPRDTVGFWPEKGSVQYYDWLVSHDQALLHRRGLAGADRPTLTFANGNTTVQYSGKLGFLHYANISLGTPKVDILVALDTGSDLLWVPCTTANPNPRSNISIYDSGSSSTNKIVPCSSSLCERQVLCTTPSDPCPYQVRYVDGTSTSGVLMEDLLYLKTADANQQQQPVKVNVTFGCAGVVTGFTSVAGIFGLGFSKISVPSTLATGGLVSDSFSMCFGRTDGVGRINFGDKGSLDQSITPFAPNTQIQDYTVTVKAIHVNNRSESGDFYAVVDSGSSFTILKDPIYTKFAEAFESQVVDKRLPRVPPGLAFEYCYQPQSSNPTLIKFPNVSLTMEGGSGFPLLRPFVFVSTTDNLFYCLAIVKNENLNIIGQNFMSGLKLVFDREKLVLGWKEFNCYNVENSTFPSGRSGLPDAPATSPASSSNQGTPAPVPAPNQASSFQIQPLHATVSVVFALALLLVSS